MSYCIAITVGPGGRTNAWVGELFAAWKLPDSPSRLHRLQLYLEWIQIDVNKPRLWSIIIVTTITLAIT
jgi:hypothetical protein